MKEDRLLKALGQVDEKYVEEASPAQHFKKPGWLKWGVMVACLCLIVVSAMSVLPKIENNTEGGNTIPDRNSSKDQTEQAISFFAHQDIIDEMQRDIPEKDVQSWAEDSTENMSIKYEYVLPVYTPDNIANSSSSILETLVFANQYKAPAVSDGTCVGTFTLVKHEGKWVISMFEGGFDIESAIIQCEGNATCFLSIPQLGTEYGFLTVTKTDETYLSITQNNQETRNGTELLELLKNRLNSSYPGSEGSQN